MKLLRRYGLMRGGGILSVIPANDDASPIPQVLFDHIRGPLSCVVREDGASPVALNPNFRIYRYETTTLSTCKLFFLPLRSLHHAEL